MDSDIPEPVKALAPVEPIHPKVLFDYHLIESIRVRKYGLPRLFPNFLDPGHKLLFAAILLQIGHGQHLIRKLLLDVIQVSILPEQGVLLVYDCPPSFVG